MQVVPSDVGDGESSQVIKAMGIGHILPTKVHDVVDQANDEDDSSSTLVEPSSTQVGPSSASQGEQITQEEPHSKEQAPSPHSLERDLEGEQDSSTSQDQDQVIVRDQNLARYEFIDHEGTTRKIKAATRSSGMQVHKILGSISKGVVTRRHVTILATFCEHHAFVSTFEPLKVHEALVDPDWVISMQEELECFTRNEVWFLVERPKDHRINVIGTKWIFKNKQDENGIITRNKARLVAQGFLK
jgi:hypothetical protein